MTEPDEPFCMPPDDPVSAAVEFRRQEALMERVKNPGKHLPPPLRAPENATLQQELDAIDTAELADLTELKDLNFRIVRRADARLEAGKLDEKTRHALVREMQLSSNQLRRLIPECARAARLVANARHRGNLKRDFFRDRALKVIEDVFGDLDKKYEADGFGCWMPFAYPDQWMIFHQTMRKVLAANGLLYAKNAEHFKRFLEETPIVSRNPKPGTFASPADYTGKPEQESPVSLAFRHAVAVDKAQKEARQRSTDQRG